MVYNLSYRLLMVRTMIFFTISVPSSLARPRRQDLLQRYWPHMGRALGLVDQNPIRILGVLFPESDAWFHMVPMFSISFPLFCRYIVGNRHTHKLPGLGRARQQNPALAQLYPEDLQLLSW